MITRIEDGVIYPLDIRHQIRFQQRFKVNQLKSQFSDFKISPAKEEAKRI